MKALLLALSFLFLLPSCKEDDMPPPLFRCKVNGVEWTPTRPDVWTPYQMFYYDDVQSISLGATRNLDDGVTNQYMTLSALPVVLGENNLKYFNRVFIDWEIANPCGGYNLDTLKPHIINIKVLDKEKGNIQGTFFFSVYDEDCNESVNITDGEFNFTF